MNYSNRYAASRSFDVNNEKEFAKFDNRCQMKFYNKHFVT